MPILNVEDYRFAAEAALGATATRDDVMDAFAVNCQLLGNVPMRTAIRMVRDHLEGFVHLGAPGG
jgi:hypothetical protein